MYNPVTPINAAARFGNPYSVRFAGQGKPDQAQVLEASRKIAQDLKDAGDHHSEVSTDKGLTEVNVKSKDSDTTMKARMTDILGAKYIAGESTDTELVFEYTYQQKIVKVKIKIEGQ